MADAARDRRRALAARHRADAAAEPRSARRSPGARRRTSTQEMRERSPRPRSSSRSPTVSLSARRSSRRCTWATTWSACSASTTPGTSGRVYQDARRRPRRDARRSASCGVLERAYLTAEAARARAPTRPARSVSELLTVGLDTRARLDAVTDVVLPTFGDACVAYLFTDDQGCSRSPARSSVRAAGRGADRRPRRPGRQHPRPRRGRHRVPDPGAGAHPRRPRRPRRAGAAVLGLRSVLVVPLLAQTEPIGVLVFGYSRSERRYTREDLAPGPRDRRPRRARGRGRDALRA